MKPYLITLFLFIAGHSFGQDSSAAKKPSRADSFEVRKLVVITLTEQDARELHQWILSSGRHSGAECQDYSEFLKHNSAIIQDSVRKK